MIQLFIIAGKQIFKSKTHIYQGLVQDNRSLTYNCHAMKLSSQETQQNQNLFCGSLTASTCKPVAEIDTRSLVNFLS